MSERFWPGKLKSCKYRGQGVIEYAGALVIAAVLVSFAIFVVPDEVASMLDSIVNAAMTYFVSSLPS